MRFADISGHIQNIELLRKMVDSNQLPHSILLSGPPGIGKMNVARALAQYIHCHNRRDGDSCGMCPACRLHAKLSNPDLRFIFPIAKKAKPKKEISEDCHEEWKGFITDYPTVPYQQWLETIEAENSQPAIHVAESHQIIKNASLSPYNENCKIFIIWLPEKMNLEAANTLLKLLEEPHADTKFILVSDEPQKILPTIFSRTVRLQFHRLTDNEVAQYIMSQGIEPQLAIEAARLAEGSLAKAMEYCSDTSEKSLFSEIFKKIMRDAYSRNVASLREISAKVNEFGREKTRRFLSYMTHMLRENYIYNYGEPSLNLLSDDDAAFSSRFAPFINGQNIEPMMKEIDRAASDIQRNANGKIVLFDLMLKFLMLIRKTQN